MTDEEILDLFGWDVSKLPAEELEKLTKKIKEEIEMRSKLLQTIRDAMDVNRQDLETSKKFLSGKIKPSVFPLREDEYPEAIKKELDEQDEFYCYTSNIITILVSKVEELESLIKNFKQFS